MVTSEPTGTEAWMPLNNHPSVKPTYDIYDTVTKGKLAIGPGRLISSGDNAADANFPAARRASTGSRRSRSRTTWSRTASATSTTRSATGANDVVYFEAQDSAIAAARKALNKVAMDQQEAITHFQEQFTGPFPFNANGIVVALPRASFEEEMQTKIVVRRRHDRRRPGHEPRHVRAREHAPVVGRQRRRGRAQADVVQGGPGDDGRVLPDRAARRPTRPAARAPRPATRRSRRAS